MDVVCGVLWATGEGGNDQVPQQFGVSLQSITLNTKWVAHQGILQDPLLNAPSIQLPRNSCFLTTGF